MLIPFWRYVIAASRRINLRVDRARKLVEQRFELNPAWQFARDIARLIWEYKAYSSAILVVTIFQEFAVLWPVNLLGQFIDRLGSGNLGNIVWLLLAASIFAPGLARGNVMLRHKMFYETDFQKMVELVLRVSDRSDATDPEAAGATYTRTANAVSGITNATYHVLGSFTPVIIKIAIVSSSLLGYNRLLGAVYLASLVIPAFMTVLFNRKLRVILDSQYSVSGEVSGAGIRAISQRGHSMAKARFREIMHTRKKILQSLIYQHQFYLYLREVVLIGSQFLVVFLALGLRSRINITPGDFAKIIGYTAQVAAAFINAAACLDAIISYSRAYHVFAMSCK